MSDFLLGLLIGLLIGLASAILWHVLYKRILVMKAEDGSREYINGKFYYIVEEGEHRDDDIQEFIIRVKMEKRWIPHFCSMLKYIEKLGKLGCSRIVAIFADGDGDFHPKFNFNIEFKEVPPMKEENGDRLYDAG